MVNELVERLEKSRDHYLAALGDIPEDNARVKPADGGWSILECAEHVAVAERGMLQMIQKSADKERPVDHAVDARILKIGSDRSRKAQSPDVAMPKGRFATLAEAAANFREGRENSLAYARETSEEALRQKEVPHPIGGILDGYQVLLLMSAHVERHILQITELLPRD